MEKGFFHPDRGYWQTVSDPDEATLASYPGGTVEVPLKPGRWYEWEGSAWVEGTPPPAPLPAELAKLAIRDEAVAQGIWSSLKTFIAADPDRQERWDLAVAIPTDDPILTDAQTALGWTDAQAEAFIRAVAAR